ncbi:ubiquitin carboxyl-terminal hydrolase 16-like isoform X2 [Papaver somniferum]|uniref:ubiquitin carboxyl-terminal hydrolase 16-like isoform X2 n=1 Tax=Papaver somniferum TaxID=3469 RepID=UPI000E6FD496|nr:ubiquitin carboxyl-terminal hydrolase 16-like isoform X2 [Papaver somniferum]
MYNCRYTNEHDELFLQILLPIPVTGDLSRASMVGNKDAAVSLITCLDQYIELEFLPGRRCDRCSCMGGNKSIRVIRAPLILTISLKRFNAENKKINDHIIFEETFDLRAYMDDRYVGGDKLEYHLIGVVVHEGSVDTGHCFAYVRGDKSGGSEEDNKDFTYCLDDLVVREVSLQQVLQSQAYMLFYEKRNSSVKQGLSYAKTSSAFGPPATPSGYGNRSEPGLAKYRVASIRTSASQIHTPISNHASSKQRHPRSRSTTYESGKQVSSERPWKSPDESSYSSWR